MVMCLWRVQRAHSSRSQQGIELHFRGWGRRISAKLRVIYGLGLTVENAACPGAGLDRF